MLEKRPTERTDTRFECLQFAQMKQSIDNETSDTIGHEIQG